MRPNQILQEHLGWDVFCYHPPQPKHPNSHHLLVRGTRTTMCGSFEQFDEQLRANQTNSSIALHRNQKQMIHIIISRMRRMQQNMYHNKKIIGIEIIVKLNY